MHATLTNKTIQKQVIETIQVPVVNLELTQMEALIIAALLGNTVGKDFLRIVNTSKRMKGQKPLNIDECHKFVYDILQEFDKVT